MNIPKLKSNDPHLQDEYNKICSVLIKFKGNNMLKLQNMFAAIGYEVSYTGKHPILVIHHKGGEYRIVMSSTPSDINAFKQVIRKVRKVFES